jgi:hypothetical protein
MVLLPPTSLLIRNSSDGWIPPMPATFGSIQSRPFYASGQTYGKQFPRYDLVMENTWHYENCTVH